MLKKIQTNWHGNKSTRKTFINDDWRLRNDLPYKAVKQHTKPTRIKLENHLSKLNVAHTKIFLRHAGESGRSKGTFFDNQSLIFITSFADARNWWVNRSLQSSHEEWGKVCLSRFDCFSLPDFLLPPFGVIEGAHPPIILSLLFVHVPKHVTMKTIPWE